MTRDDIIRMAEGSGLDRILGDWLHEFTLDSWPATEIPELERFAALVAAVEREACAKACEDLEDKENPYERNVAVLDCASAIRARGEI